MRLEIGGEVVETYPLTEIDKDLADARNPDDEGRAELVHDATITYFWTPQAHPWQEGQSVVITAQMTDSDGSVYERQLTLIS